MTDGDGSNFVSVRAEDRADRAGEGSGAAKARATRGRAREAIVTAGTAATARVRDGVSATRPEDTRTLWRDGAEAPAQLLDVAREGGEERSKGWRLYMRTVAPAVALLAVWVSWVFSRPGRGALALTLGLVLFLTRGGW